MNCDDAFVQRRSTIKAFTRIRWLCEDDGQPKEMHMKRFPTPMKLLVLATVMVAGSTVSAQQSARKFIPVSDAMLQKPDPGDWLMWRRTLDGWGYSPLAQVNKTNVAQLRMVWTRALSAGNTQETTPLIHDGVMYLSSAGDYIQALD